MKTGLSFCNDFPWGSLFQIPHDFVGLPVLTAKRGFRIYPRWLNLIIYLMCGGIVLFKLPRSPPIERGLMYRLPQSLVPTTRAPVTQCRWALFGLNLRTWMPRPVSSVYDTLNIIFWRYFQHSVPVVGRGRSKNHRGTNAGTRFLFQ